VNFVEGVTDGNARVQVHVFVSGVAILKTVVDIRTRQVIKVVGKGFAGSKLEVQVPVFVQNIL